MTPDEFFENCFLEVKIEIFLDSFWKKWSEWRRNGDIVSRDNQGVFGLVQKMTSRAFFHSPQSSICSPLFSFFRFVPSFATDDQVVY